MGPEGSHLGADGSVVRDSGGSFVGLLLGCGVIELAFRYPGPKDRVGPPKVRGNRFLVEGWPGPVGLPKGGESSPLRVQGNRLL